MEYGLFNLMPQREASKDPREVFSETIEQVRLAEELGFGTAWFAEHHFSNYCLCPSPIAMAIHLAGLTKRIRLGTAVIVAPLYQPLRILEDLALLDILSDGRLVIGLGSGYQQYEFHKFGVNVVDGRNIFLETLDVLEQFLADGVVEYHGKHVSIPRTEFRLRTRQLKPSIYVAGLGEDDETQRRIGTSGYVSFFNKGWNSLDTLAASRRKTEMAAKGGTDEGPPLPYALQQYIYVTDDRNEALRAADGARYIRRVAMSMRNRYAEISGSFLKEVEAPNEPSLDVLVERMMIGSPQKCAEMLAAEMETLQPSHMSCFMNIPGMEHREVMRSMERFAQEVMPVASRQLASSANADKVEGAERAAGLSGSRVGLRGPN
jgi:alkanesulfonate monooxygenase SsuD/methylene tetrahydromethanopterin reductase-like flavin-dependent oxidoreductase (luciferase family)